MMPLKSYSNEGPSSAENMQTKGPSAKRKISDSNNCHQCHRNDKERVVRCTQCDKNYCIACITKWYTGMQEKDFADACPDCRDICNCTACLQSDVANQDLLVSDLKLGTNDKIQYSKYIVRVLLPSLKQFVVEQNMEREEEARIQGLSTTELQLPKAHFIHDDQGKCNNCKTSIFDIHRSCANCSYKLCVTCCREMRDAFPWTTYGRSWAASCSMNYANSKWSLTEKGTIVCPPEGIGGCGRSDLDLKSTYPDNWVPELLMKAESVPEVGKLTDGIEPIEGPCLCSQGSELDCGMSSKSASPEEGKVNNFHCPAVVSVEKQEQKNFQWHLRNGEPIIVPNVLCGTTGLSWEPFVMWRACRKSRRANDSPIVNFRVMNCLNGCEETINMHHFFKGYVDGLFDSEGRLQILKLEQWPPSESLRERLPRHFLELLRCLPFKLYTHPLAGYLNMSSKIPEMSLKPDLGPKMCFAYGVEEELGFNSVTNLQYALSDRVNVLVHTTGICRENENERKERVDPSISGSRAQRFKDTEGGPIWDVFRRQDVPKLEEYLKKHSGEFRHISPLQQIVHPVHEKAFYLTVEHKWNLKGEYGIEPWTFVQRLGDAVFVPAGCPHQVKNLKSCTSASVNFVSPESVGECIRLSTEYRRLPDNHSCKDDKLQVKKMTLHAISQAVHYLDTNTPSTPRTQITPPSVHVNLPKNPSQPGERPRLALMRKELEGMMLTLEKEGPRINKYMKVYLEKAIPDLLKRICTMQESSSSN